MYTKGNFHHCNFHHCIEGYRVHGMIGDVYLNAEEIEKFLKVLI